MSPEDDVAHWPPILQPPDMEKLVCQRLLKQRDALIRQLWFDVAPLYGSVLDEDGETIPEMVRSAALTRDQASLLAVILARRETT